MSASAFPTLPAELARFNEEQVLHLLGEILQPSINSPFRDFSDAFLDALLPIERAYADAFRELQSVAAGEHLWDAEENAAASRADFLRDEALSLTYVTRISPTEVAA